MDKLTSLGNLRILAKASRKTCAPGAGGSSSDALLPALPHPKRGIPHSLKFQISNFKFQIFNCSSFVLTAFCLVLTGCARFGIAPRDLALGPGYCPENIYARSHTLPPNLKRVAVLPLTTDERDIHLVEGREALEPVLRAEMTKTTTFDVVCPETELLCQRAGPAAWAEEEALPPNFLGWLRERTGCDAVLFCRLTVFRGYTPLAVGWRLRLVDARTADTLWAADEVFDAGRPEVQAGARRYQLAESRNSPQSPDDWLIRTSPREFGQYAAAQLLATMPKP